MEIDSAAATLAREVLALRFRAATFYNKVEEFQ
jgi:hypothetical protein